MKANIIKFFTGFAISFISCAAIAQSAAGSCAQYDGAFVYDNITKFHNSLVIYGPGLMIAGKKVVIDQNWGEDDAEGDGLCAALNMGYLKGHVNETASAMGQVKAALNKKGELEWVQRDLSSTGRYITSITCQK